MGKDIFKLFEHFRSLLSHINLKTFRQSNPVTQNYLSALLPVFFVRKRKKPDAETLTSGKANLPLS